LIGATRGYLGRIWLQSGGGGATFCACVASLPSQKQPQAPIFQGDYARFRGRNYIAVRIGRVDVSEPVSISKGIAARYATAVFELAKEGKKLKGLETDVDALDAALDTSADFRDLITSPLYTREQQTTAIDAISKKMKLSATVANTLSLMAAKRRLFVLPQLVGALRALIADEKGEVTADVTAVVKVGSKMIDTSIRSKLASLQNSMKEVG